MNEENELGEQGNNGENALGAGEEKPEEIKKEAEKALIIPPDKGLSKQIEEALMADTTEEELIKRGFNKGTVRIVAFNLEKAGKRQRPSRLTPLKAGMQIYAKGSPPEAIVEAFRMPKQVSEEFSEGLRFGAMSIILGVKVAQELSEMGIKQARPLLEMARDMRAGEAAAAKSAAIEAAAIVGAQTESLLGPLAAQVASLSRVSSGVDPMKQMMVDMMKPIMKTMMAKFLPGMPQENTSGWTITQEETKQEEETEQ